MKTILLSAFFCLLTSGAFAQSVTVKYDDLRGIDETVRISNVKIDKIQDGTGFSVYEIRLLIEGNSACGEEFFTQNVDGVQMFYQLGFYAYGHMQPGCSETIEYLWGPQDFDVDIDQTKKLTIKIGPYESYENGQMSTGYFEVSVEGTRKLGDFPNGRGMGNYFIYANPKVKLVKLVKQPL
ncbi:MAG: hypothetical protein ACPGJV_04030 [Bacteriovoracaceae bacterium]